MEQIKNFMSFKCIALILLVVSTGLTYFISLFPQVTMNRSPGCFVVASLELQACEVLGTHLRSSVRAEHGLNQNTISLFLVGLFLNVFSEPGSNLDRVAHLSKFFQKNSTSLIFFYSVHAYRKWDSVAWGSICLCSVFMWVVVREMDVEEIVRRYHL